WLCSAPAGAPSPSAAPRRWAGAQPALDATTAAQASPAQPGSAWSFCKIVVGVPPLLLLSRQTQRGGRHFLLKRRPPLLRFAMAGTALPPRSAFTRRAGCGPLDKPVDLVQAHEEGLPVAAARDNSDHTLTADERATAAAADSASLDHVIARRVETGNVSNLSHRRGADPAAHTENVIALANPGRIFRERGGPGNP